MSKFRFGNKNHSLVLVTTAGLMGLSTILTSTPAHAVLINGGFETGNFTGWTTSGNTSIKTAAYGSNPTGGNFAALLSTTTDGVVATPSDLEDFLGLAPFSLDNINGAIFSGSGLKQTFFANAGETLSFDWNFLTNEASQSANYNSFAFVNINSVSKLADTFSSLIPSNTPFVSETGYRTFTYTIPTTGNYTLGIGVANVGDSFGGSGILIDRVSSSTATTSTVPEPSDIAGLLTFGILGMALRFKPRQQKA